MDSRIVEIAREARKWAEKRRPAGDNLMGLCAKASAKLFRMLQEANIRCEIRAWTEFPSGGGSAHVFVVVDDHVVDVTATQFRQFKNDKVVVMHEREAAQHYFYNAGFIFGSVYELKKWQTDSGWPRDQVAAY